MKKLIKKLLTPIILEIMEENGKEQLAKTIRSILSEMNLKDYFYSLQKEK